MVDLLRSDKKKHEADREMENGERDARKTREHKPDEVESVHFDASISLSFYPSIPLYPSIPSLDISV